MMHHYDSFCLCLYLVVQTVGLRYIGKIRYLLFSEEFSALLFKILKCQLHHASHLVHIFELSTYVERILPLSILACTSYLSLWFKSKPYENTYPCAL